MPIRLVASHNHPAYPVRMPTAVPPDLTTPKSLSMRQRIYPNEAACIDYLHDHRSPNGFNCPRCGVTSESFRLIPPKVQQRKGGIHPLRLTDIGRHDRRVELEPATRPVADLG
jgi:hypothetical protein